MTLLARQVVRCCNVIFSPVVLLVTVCVKCPICLAACTSCVRSTGLKRPKRARELQNVLLERGYKNKLIKECIMKARKAKREESLKTKLNASTDRVSLVVTYNPTLPNLHKILNDHQHILHTSSKCQTISKEIPLVAGGSV